MSICLTKDGDSSRRLMFFFFSSRRRHTRCSRDWSSDVCSSDLARQAVREIVGHEHFLDPPLPYDLTNDSRETRGFHALMPELMGVMSPGEDAAMRSEERRVGKECRSRWSPYH